MSYSDTSGDSVRVAACRESRRDRAHKRFLAACKALATVRRLGIPSVVVNQVVARQDVNVGGVASIPKLSPGFIPVKPDRNRKGRPR